MPKGYPIAPRPQRNLDEHIEHRWLRGDSLGDVQISVKRCFGLDMEMEDLRLRFVAAGEKWGPDPLQKTF